MIRLRVRPVKVPSHQVGRDYQRRTITKTSMAFNRSVGDMAPNKNVAIVTIHPLRVTNMKIQLVANKYNCEPMLRAKLKFCFSKSDNNHQRSNGHPKTSQVSGHNSTLKGTIIQIIIIGRHAIQYSTVNREPS